MNKAWLIGTAKVVGVAALGAGLAQLSSEISAAAFASAGLAKVVIMGIGVAIAYLKHPPAEIRKPQ